MKKLLLLAILLLAILMVLSTASFAASVHVLIPNYNSYGKGMICVVDAQYNGQFSDIIHAHDFNTSRTDRNSAFKVVSFFNNVDKDACYVPKGTQQRIDVPNRSTVYVVTVVMTPNGSSVYWNVTNLNTTSGAIMDQFVTVDAPAL